MKRWIIFLIILIALLTGCEQIAKSQNPLVGNWVFQGLGFQEILTIQPDNTLYLSNNLGRKVYSYQLGNGKILLTDLDSGEKGSYDFEIIGDYKAIKFRGVPYYPYEKP